MACKCTQTTVNATGGGSITSALSGCTYPFYVHNISGCTDNNVNFGVTDGNVLFNVNRVGINNPEPSHDLSVGGTVDVRDYLHLGDGYSSGDTSASVYLGYKAGSTRSTNSNSPGNTSIGYESLGSTGVLNVGHYNTTVGFWAGRKITSGNFNTIVGAASAYNLTNGIFNTIIGGGSGDNLDSGSHNVYIGYGLSPQDESNVLRIGNADNGIGQRSLIEGSFATSGLTIWGDQRIVTTSTVENPIMTIDSDGYVNKSLINSTTLYANTVTNIGSLTANTTDAAGQPWGDGEGFRSVTLSGSVNSTETMTDWTGTRLGIGTNYPSVPLHVKSPSGWIIAEATNNASYIESLSSSNIAYLGMATLGGAKSGSTTWRTKAFSSALTLLDHGIGTSSPVGSGFSIMRYSRSEGDPISVAINPISIVGDGMETLDGAVVIRSTTESTGLGGGGNSMGIGIFTTTPTKELTVVGAMSATGSIHSTDYIKFPNPSFSTHIGFQSGSGTTLDIYNTSVGHRSQSGLNGGGARYNTSLGFNSLPNLLNGDNNISIGGDSLQSLISGSENVSIGSGSGWNIRGNGNVTIGHKSGYGISTGINNIAIGHQVDVNSPTDNDQINVNNLIFGSDTYTNGASQEFGISTPYSPKTALDVFYRNITSLVRNTGGGETVTFGDEAGDYQPYHLVQLRGAGWGLSDANSTEEQGCLLGLGLIGGAREGIMVKGYYHMGEANEVGNSWRQGGPLYVSGDPGKIVSIPPTGSSTYVRVVGYMTSQEGVMYFNPSSEYIVNP